MSADAAITAAPGAAPAAGPGDALPPEAYAAAMAALPGMGPSRLAAILAARPPEVAWRCLVQGVPWHDPGVVRALGGAAVKLIDQWRAAAGAVDVGASWRHIAELDVVVTMRCGPGYPGPLVHDVEPPPVAFHLGDPAILSGPRVAIVGTRRCSTTGRSVAAELGRDLASAGVSVVSGLAAGIDGAAHRGALAVDGAPPVGVVGSGLDVVYPAGQRGLWDAVARTGLLLSEAPPGARPERWRFPARNRIIAALADLVVVVESHRRGGSLHTVDEADRRGVDVFAVPGSVRNPAAAGTNELLAEGRAPACSADDVLMALGLAASRGAGPDPRPTPEPDDAEVLDLVGWQPATLDELVLRTGRDLARLAPALDRLCQARWVERHGGWYERVGVARAPR